MKLKYIDIHGLPVTPGIYWVIIQSSSDDEKDTAAWNGERWRYTENAADHLWGEPYGSTVVAWVDCVANEKH